MITLHQFPRAWDIPRLSPFCAKVETCLRMAELAYEVADAIPPTASRGKLPYLVDDGETISDSPVATRRSSSSSAAGTSTRCRKLSSTATGARWRRPLH